MHDLTHAEINTCVSYGFKISKVDNKCIKVDKAYVTQKENKDQLQHVSFQCRSLHFFHQALHNQTICRLLSIQVILD